MKFSSIFFSFFFWKTYRIWEIDVCAGEFYFIFRSFLFKTSWQQYDIVKALFSFLSFFYSILFNFICWKKFIFRHNINIHTSISNEWKLFICSTYFDSEKQKRRSSSHVKRSLIHICVVWGLSSFDWMVKMLIFCSIETACSLFDAFN